MSSSWLATVWALIGFPIVDAPDTVWDVVLARVEEITLGIVCTTVIGSIVFPIPLGPALTARLDNWLRDAADWTLGVLSGAPESAAKSPAMLSRSGCWRHISPTIHPICRPPLCRLRSCTSASSCCCRWSAGAADRIRILREIGGIPPGLRAVLDRIGSWIQSGSGADLSEAAEMHADIDALEPEVDATVDLCWSACLCGCAS
jgi:hypothetical protein